jgi:nitronate monooxygenase
MGTRFIATHESMADHAYKEILVASSTDDVLLTRALTGRQTNMLRPSIVAAGLNPDNLPQRGSIDVANDISIEAHETRPTRWRDLWSAGHTTSGVDSVLTVGELIARTLDEYHIAARTLNTGRGIAIPA